MREYYVHNGNDRLGPFTLDEIKNQAITPDTFIWYEGLPSWTTARNVEEFSTFLIKNKIQSDDISANKSQAGGIKKYLKIVGVVLGFILILYLGLVFFGSSNSNNSSGTIDNTSGQGEVNSSNPDNTNIDSQQENTQNDEEVEKRRKIEELESSQRYLRNNWSSYINVQSSDYKYREMGGIFDLYLTVYNNTDYRLDAGRVHIDIIKANGDIFTTNTLDFTNLDAHNSVVLRVPDCERGTSIGSPEFDGLFAKDFNFCYDASRPFNPSDENDFNKCQN
jgi:hypothetical protein